jgi:2-iminobutanoate/2-iminopropanoate deaminase
LITPIAHYQGLAIANGFVFCSGQVGIEAQGKIVAGIEAQTRQAIQNLSDLLTEKGLSLKDIVKTTVYITDNVDYEPMNQAYRAAFGDSQPARTTVIVAGLPKAESEGPEPILFEIEAVAVTEGGD